MPTRPTTKTAFLDYISKAMDASSEDLSNDYDFYVACQQAQTYVDSVIPSPPPPKPH